MRHSPDRTDYREVACELARRGAEAAQPCFGKVAADRKADDTPVTEADRAAQRAILEVLADRFPSHGVLAEETLDRPEHHAPPGSTDYCWVIDPLDGTRNFVRGVAVYATSVALLLNNEPVAGAVHDATTGRVYSAALGGGAFCDDQPMRLDDRPLDADTTVMISSFRRRRIPKTVRCWLDRYLFRNQGSLCLHLVWVAAGLADAAYALECKLWDIAAAALIIREAGGLVTDHSGGPLWPRDPARYHEEDIPILAGTPTMHTRLLASLLKGAEGNAPEGRPCDADV